MDSRRASRAIIDPKLRRVGFFAARAEPDPPEHDPLPLSESPSSITIPPPRHLSERTAAVPVPETGLRRQVSGDRLPIGSYNPSESLLGTSPAASHSSSGAGIGDGEFSEDCSGAGWFRGSELSFRGAGFDLPAVKPPENSTENSFAVAVNVKNIPGGTGTLFLTC
ncbi:putative translation initiation factor eIF-2B subunit delta-like [Sesbania bispinosa]|nr:putative translation initiation factor eIF-2B subunit delta-like [Sesbania bispinosa]